MRCDRGFALALAAVALLLGAFPAECQIYTRMGRDGVVEATNVPDASNYRLTYPGKGTLIHSRGFRGHYSGEFDQHILDAARAFGVPAELVRAVIQIESEFDRWAVSSKGAQGLMQLMPFTARRFGVFDSFEPRQNIFGGVQYLRFLLDLFQGDVALALAGYNAGENAVLRYKGVPPYKETRGYVQKIQALYGEAPTLPAYVPARYYAPAARANGAARPAKPARSAQPTAPVRPRVYYKWRDAQGVLHVAQQPPPEGVTYVTIRALD